MRVLVAEDEFLVRILLAEELADRGFEVHEAGTGDQAALLIAERTHPFDLLVTDLQMPGKLDGLGLARLMRVAFPAIPVVYITGRPDIVVDHGVLGAKDRLVSKPFTPSELFAVIRALLGEVPEGSPG